ncbi:MAG: hypothetical protein ACRC4L_00895 [Mycoplasma sp.]
MKTSKIKKIKKWITWGTTAVLTAGAFASIGYGIYYQYENTIKSNDFSSGRSVQFEMRIYKVDENGRPIDNEGNIVTSSNDLVPIYSKEKEKENLEITATAITNILQEKKLNNIRVSFGYGNASNKLFPNEKEKVAIIYCDFENSETSLDLLDISEEANQLLNNKKVYSTISAANNYELELIKPSYNSAAYPAQSSTERNELNSDKTGLFYDEEDDFASGTNFNLQDSPDLAEKIKQYKNKDLDGDYVAATANKNFNAWAFALERQQYEKLSDGSSSRTYVDNELNNTIINSMYGNESWYNDGSYTAVNQKTYQTKNTWLLWKDKQGLINHLNNLISIWYYHLYANTLPTSLLDPSSSDYSISSQISLIFNTSDDLGYKNHIDPDSRKQINKLIDDLSSTEKEFITMAAHMSSGSNNPSKWAPQLITENDLIPILYNFNNSKQWNSSYSEPSEEEMSQSELNGWDWLESDSSSLSSLTNDYLESKIDHKNYNDYFFNEAEGDKESDKEFTTNKFLLRTKNGMKPKEYSDFLNNNFKFKIINSKQSNLVEDFPLTNQKIIELAEKANKIDWSKNESEEVIQFKEERKAFANKHFSSNTLFAQQNESKSIYDDSWVKLNSIDILMIILGAVVFLIGIFVSIRYRIPGVVAFITSLSVLILGSTLYVFFGFTLSFYAIIALAFGVFLSLLSPFFFFRNVKKEVSEKLSITGTVVKSLKKYWKMSLDIHMISLLSSLSFLFFGIGGNINFGAMLVISVFLSFILSGVIFYLILFMYTQFTQMNESKFYFDKKLFNSILDGKSKDITNSKYFKFLTPMVHKLSFYNKWTKISIGIISLLSVVGIILLSTIGSFGSIDFNNSNIFIINNFDETGLSLNDVINTLKISTINAYVYNNELIIFTKDNIDLADAISKLKSSVSLVDQQSSIELGTRITQLTTAFSIDVVVNTIKCVSIAIGFSSIWALLSLNIVGMIPLALTQFITVITMVGFIGISQIPVNLEVIPVILLVYLFASVISTSMLSSLKRSWNREMLTQVDQLKLLSESITSKFNVNYFYLGIGIISFAGLSMIFASPGILLSLLVLIIGVIWSLIFVNRVLMNIWYLCIIIRDKFSKELSHSEKHQRIKINYDEVDEQIITGINN